MRIHHLNCVSSCPLGGRLMDGRSRSVLQRGSLCCHCLLLETRDALVLIDTGFGLRDIADPATRLSRFFLALLSPDFREEMTAVRQIERLGFSARDVRHIVLTHLDFDHAGGLDDFPEASVHLLRSEVDGAVAQRTWMDRQRFRPQQWASRPRWQAQEASGGERWFGFDAVRAVPALRDKVLLVHHAEMDPVRPRFTPGLRLYQTMLEKHRRLRLENQRRLRTLAATHAGELEVFCAHDPLEYERLAGRPMAQPVSAR